jgi:hypothetical protein
MAFIWLNGAGDGISIAETVGEAHRKTQEQYDGLIEFTHADTLGVCYVDKDSIMAIEPGRGADEGEED